MLGDGGFDELGRRVEALDRACAKRLAGGVEPPGVDRSGAEGRVIEDPQQERKIRSNAQDGKRTKGRRQTRDGAVSRFRRGNDLREQRIVMNRHLAPLDDPGIDPYAGRARMWHSGSTRGFSTAIERFPAENLTVVVLANRTDLDAPKLALRVADAVR